MGAQVAPGIVSIWFFLGFLVHFMPWMSIGWLYWTALISSSHHMSDSIRLDPGGIGTVYAAGCAELPSADGCPVEFRGLQTLRHNDCSSQYLLTSSSFFFVHVLTASPPLFRYYSLNDSSSTPASRACEESVTIHCERWRAQNDRAMPMAMFVLPSPPPRLREM